MDRWRAFSAGAACAAGVARLPASMAPRTHALPMLLLLPLLRAPGATAAEAPAWVRELRAANCARARADVSEMYEDLPYPSRDPGDEAPGEPFALDPPSTPAAIAHRAYGGALDFYALGRAFRILVAGRAALRVRRGAVHSPRLRIAWCGEPPRCYRSGPLFSGSHVSFVTGALSSACASADLFTRRFPLRRQAMLT